MFPTPAHRHALASVRGGRHPGTGAWSSPNSLAVVALGPIGSCAAVRRLTCLSMSSAIEESPLSPRGCAGNVSAALEVVIAYRLLFGIYSGIVPDGIVGLGSRASTGPRFDGGAVLRQTGAQPPKRHLAAAERWLLEQWLAHSALLRFRATGRASRRCGWGCASPVIPSDFARRGTGPRSRWDGIADGIVGEDGEPLKLHRSRIPHHASRDRTGQEVLDRECSRHIDPNPPAAVEGRPLPAATPANATRDNDHRRRRARHPPTDATDQQ